MFPAPRFQPPYLHILYSEHKPKTASNELANFSVWNNLKKTSFPPGRLRSESYWSRNARTCQPAQVSQPSPLRRGQARETRLSRSLASHLKASD